MAIVFYFAGSVNEYHDLRPASVTVREWVGTFSQAADGLLTWLLLTLATLDPLAEFDPGRPPAHLPAIAHPTQRYLAMITGDVGPGKSTAVRAFIHSLDVNLHLVAYLSNPNLTVQAFFAQLLSAFRISSAFHPHGLGERLRNTLADFSQHGCHPLVVVDEAHLLSHRLLHELRHLLQLKGFDALDQRIHVRLSYPAL